MPFRLLRYVVRVWERWQRDHKGAKTLPIVLPVLLHHGNGTWKAAPYQAAPAGMPAAEIQSIVLQIAGPEGAEDAMNAAEELIERGRAEGEARGRAEGLRTAITALFSARRLPLSDNGRARIAACADLPTLTKWHERAATASAEAEVFGDGESIG